ncbi:MAG: MBL fold metallo-hydrolase [Rubrivivax sp.]|jgi:glyoxylase-like metal-dependent hydrolase (beta-lactamase superfamily II)|nr:MBL fold metallo-hydrolase [Rubrivivax sp.]
MSNATELERALHFPLGDALPAPGRTLAVAPGVRWLRMALPFALDHINLWLLEDTLDGRRGWTIVDCGIDDADTRARWEQVFADELGGLPVLRVVVTHMHPDHIGLAHWLCDRWSVPGRECRLWISATDWGAARMASESTTSVGGEAAAAFFARHGLVDEAALAQVRARRNHYASLVPQVPARYRRLMDGHDLRVADKRWHCIAGYGHAPEHIALHGAEAGVLIAGDMVLPRISTNVSVIDLEPEANPLRLYLDSLHAMRGIPARTLVLPSHGRPFVGLHTRIAQLQQHHDDRLADTLAACLARPTSAHDLLPLLFRRPLDLHQTTFAMGEAVAHLHALVEDGRIGSVCGDDGVLRFSTTGA